MPVYLHPIGSRNLYLYGHDTRDARSTNLEQVQLIRFEPHGKAKIAASDIDSIRCRRFRIAH
jgi:hypothetical protein